MAIILGSKPVQDIKQYNDYAIGITLPIQIGDVAFNQSYTTLEQIKTNIKSLLLTKKGERLMQPQLGSGLQELLFESIDDDLASKIEDIIVSSIETWLPYVTIQQINLLLLNFQMEFISIKNHMILIYLKIVKNFINSLDFYKNIKMINLKISFLNVLKEK